LCREEAAGRGYRARHEAHEQQVAAAEQHMAAFSAQQQADAEAAGRKGLARLQAARSRVAAAHAQLAANAEAHDRQRGEAARALQASLNDVYADMKEKVDLFRCAVSLFCHSAKFVFDACLLHSM
jgi:hypothetical protein